MVIPSSTLTRAQRNQLKKLELIALKQEQDIRHAEAATKAEIRRAKARQRMAIRRAKIRELPPEEQLEFRDRARKAQAKYRERHRRDLQLDALCYRNQKFLDTYGSANYPAHVQKCSERRRQKLARQRAAVAATTIVTRKACPDDDLPDSSEVPTSDDEL
ncbi:hypothetical protein C8J57DRAFT_1223731 [Mycena rebaudengoi]|nr:hypothetical protein C8J57DRAFT_1223731 [Mycena rebaudengoi]